MHDTITKGAHTAMIRGQSGIMGSEDEGDSDDEGSSSCTLDECEST